jgi:hypothetical protein
MAKNASVMANITALHREAEAAHLRLVRADGEPVLLEKKAGMLARIDALQAEAESIAGQPEQPAEPQQDAAARQQMMDRIGQLDRQARAADTEALAAKLEEIKQAVATAETSKGQARPGRTETDIDALVEEKVQEILVRDLPRLVRDELLALKEAASVLADTPSATPAAIPPASQAAAPDRKRRTRKTGKG